MKPTTIQELYDTLPFGALVRFNDGTPKPPARFNRKVAEWERSNGQGFFAKRHKNYFPESVPEISLMLIQSDVLIYKQGFCVTSKLNFEIEPPPPGTVIDYREFEGDIEVNRVHKDFNAYLEWCRRNRYTPFGHSGSFGGLWIIDEKGERQPLKETPAAVAV